MTDINVYEACTLLFNMLNINGFQTKFLKKKKDWIYTKYNKKECYGNPVVFTADDVALLQDGILSASQFIKDRILKLPSECNDADIYKEYAQNRIKELRTAVSMNYICEHYCEIGLRTMQQKVRGDLNYKGYPNRLNEKNVTEINAGLRAVADLLANMKLTL